MSLVRHTLTLALNKLFSRGNLTVTFADGTTRRFGDGAGTKVHIAFQAPHAERRFLFNPGLGFPECYMDGDIELVEGDVWALMEALFQYNQLPSKTTWPYRLQANFAKLTRRLHQRNSLRKSRSNVAHHYDLDVTFYDLFLDTDRQYSCAYFETPEATLEEAQLAKKRHLASKMLLRDGLKVLDIGCGFGGMALYMAEKFDIEVTGITLSKEQHAIATQRAEEKQIADRVRFELMDYRDLDQKFDRIVSVGMFEHVGVGYFQSYFQKCHDLLQDDGVFVLHSIGRNDGPGYTHPFIEKYIFPGGYIPAVSEVVPVIEKVGFHITDLEILRLHYAETLLAWRQNFNKNREAVKTMYDERFCRMWEFYLAGSESSFRHQMMMNFQFQLTKSRTATPITRNYMIELEEKLR